MHPFVSGARRIGKFRYALPSLVAIACLSLFLSSCGGVGGSSSSGLNAGQSSSNHVFLIVLENKAYPEVIGNASMPYLNSLAQQYAVATNYFANAKPSLPNYFMLTTGLTLTNDDNFGGTVSDDNIVRELTAANKTWKVYAENLPGVGYTGPDSFPYVKHHNPMAYFSDVLNSTSQQANIVPYSQLSSDLASGAAPSFALIVPNDYDNGHTCQIANCTTADLTSATDQWLQANVPGILGSSAMQNGVLVIVYDESEPNDTANGGGHVAFVVAGAGVKRGFVSGNFYQHQNTLRMILGRLGVTSFPGAASSASDMSEFFQ